MKISKPAEATILMMSLASGLLSLVPDERCLYASGILFGAAIGFIVGWVYGLTQTKGKNNELPTLPKTNG